jgi:hypothetical protein
MKQISTPTTLHSNLEIMIKFLSQAILPMDASGEERAGVLLYEENKSLL